MKKKVPHQKEYIPPVDVAGTRTKPGALDPASKLGELVDPTTAAKLHALAVQNKRKQDAVKEAKKLKRRKIA